MRLRSRLGRAARATGAGGPPVTVVLLDAVDRWLPGRCARQQRRAAGGRDHLRPGRRSRGPAAPAVQAGGRGRSRRPSGAEGQLGARHNTSGPLLIRLERLVRQRPACGRASARQRAAAVRPEPDRLDAWERRELVGLLGAATAPCAVRAVAPRHRPADRLPEAPHHGPAAGAGREAGVKATYGSLNTTLARLGCWIAESPPAASEHRDEAGWLALFEQRSRDGWCDREPDFPKALALCRSGRPT